MSPSRLLRSIPCLTLALLLTPLATFATPSPTAADPRPAEEPTQAKPKRGGAKKSAKMQTNATLPGNAAAETVASGFNVLEYVAFDAKTKEIEMFGRLDPASSAPPIDYRRVLAEALENTSPQFSLDSDFATFTRGAFAGKNLDQILYTPDRQLTPFGEVTFSVLKLTPPAEGTNADFTSLALRSAGFSLAADLRAELPDADRKISPQTFARWIEILGLVEDYAKFTAAAKEGGGARASAADTFYQKLLQGLAGSLDEKGSEVPAAYRRLRASNSDPDVALREALVLYRRQLQALIVPAIAILAERHQQPAVVYSSADLAKAFGSPPISRPRFSQLDPKTELARLLFEGDVALKSIPFDSALRAIEGYQTFPRWADAYIAADDLGASWDTRYWITWDSATIKESPDRTVAEVGAAKLKVESRSKGSDEPWSAEKIDPRTKAYADELTRRLDAIAERSPALYRLREAAKVVAIASWLQGNGSKPRLDPPGAPWDAPAEVTGFLAMLPYERGERVLWGVWPSGGVDLDLQGKMVIEQDPTLSLEALRARVGGAKPPAAPLDPAAERMQSLLAPVDPRGLTTSRAQLEKRRLDQEVASTRGLRDLMVRQRSARDGLAVMSEYLMKTQQGQATTLQEGGRALARAAAALAQVRASLPTASGAEREARAAPSLDDAALAARATALLPELEALAPESIHSFNPALTARLDALAGDEGLAPVASGVLAAAARLMDLEQRDPAAFTRLASDSPAVQPFLANAALGDLALSSYHDEARTLADLLPNLSTGMQTDAALNRNLTARLAQIESGRQALEALRQ